MILNLEASASLLTFVIGTSSGNSVEEGSEIFGRMNWKLKRESILLTLTHYLKT
jgi:hypothetical protein